MEKNYRKFNGILYPAAREVFPMDNKQSSTNIRGLHALELKKQGKSLSEIADYFRVSRERARQILLRAESDFEAYRKFEKLKELCSTLLPQPEIPAEILNLSIDYLNLSSRASLRLKFVHIETIGDLISKPSINLLKIQNMGKKTLNDILFALNGVGLSFADMPIRFPLRQLPPVSDKMRYILTKRGWNETTSREWKFGYDGTPMNWEEAAILELKRDTALNIEGRL